MTLGYALFLFLIPPFAIFIREKVQPDGLTASLSTIKKNFRTPYIFVLACLVCLPLLIRATESSAQPEVETFPELTVTDSRIHTDYTWLADSLGRRVTEINRYPDDSRRNGWEGKVVLRVTIGTEGGLRDVTVQNSSGYEPLDQAAQEDVRQACPIPLQREIHRPEVTITLPVIYRLFH